MDIALVILLTDLLRKGFNLNHSEFERAVRNYGKAVEKAYLNIAISAMADRDHYYTSDVARTIEIASRLQASMPALQEGQQHRPTLPGMREFIDSDELCDRLEPKIREIRKECFKSEEPLFAGTKSDPITGVPKIGEWLKARAIRPKDREKIDHELELSLRTDLQNLTGAEVEVMWPALSFPQKNSQTGKWESGAIAIPVDSLIYPLYREVKNL